MLSFVLETLIFQTMEGSTYVSHWFAKVVRSGSKLLRCLYVVGCPLPPQKGSGYVRCSDIESLLMSSVRNGGTKPMDFLARIFSAVVNLPPTSWMLSVGIGRYSLFGFCYKMIGRCLVLLLCCYLPDDKVRVVIENIITSPIFSGD